MSQKWLKQCHRVPKPFYGVYGIVSGGVDDSAFLEHFNLERLVNGFGLFWGDTSLWCQRHWDDSSGATAYFAFGRTILRWLSCWRHEFQCVTFLGNVRNIVDWCFVKQKWKQLSFCPAETKNSSGSAVRTLLDWFRKPKRRRVSRFWSKSHDVFKISINWTPEAETNVQLHNTCCEELWRSQWLQTLQIRTWCC